MRLIFAAFCAAFLAANAEAYAQTPELQLGGWIDALGVVESGDFASRSAFAGARLHLNLDAEYEAFTARLAAEQPTTSDLGDQGWSSAVREGWVRYSSSAVDLTIGRQFLPEGRSDRLRPQDQFAPRDLTQVTTLDAEQRLGLPAVRVDYFATDMLTLTVAYIYQDRAYILPRDITDRLPPGRDLRHDPVNGALARAEWRGEAIELGSSLTYGASPLPALRTTATGVEQDTLTQTRLAVDASYRIGPGILRGDVAWLRTDADEDTPGVASRGWFASVGWDQGLWTDASVIAQFLHRHAALPADSSEPLLAAIQEANRSLQQTSQGDQTWITVNLKQRFGASQDAEAGLLLGEDDEYALFGLWRWRPADQWELSLQLQAADGPSGSLSKTLLPERRAFTALRYQF